MPEYDFYQLSPHDLERLVRDLLQAQWSVRLESFKTGRDGGIDLRHARGSGNFIVQVKHYVRTGFAGLLRDLKKEDAKIAKLAPSRYVVVTSVPLSPANKDKIVATLPSAPLTVSDIFGQDDLNNLLGSYPAIEQGHPKLWLTSRAVLDRVLHNAEITRSEFEVDKICKQIRRYVQTDVFREAEGRLAEQSVVMVIGPPGIGKTTLARMLLYEHLSQGWQAVVMDRDVTEGAQLFQRHVKQIFYFDDFIGATLIGEGVSANDKALLNFIASVRDDSTSRLILTTREHLYEQAVARSERLRQAGLDTDRVTLRMPRYTTQQRAQILYNHIYFSDLPDAHVIALLKDDFYHKIIHHKRYNPRVIEWMASYQRIRNVPATKYRGFVGQLLNNPLEIWLHAYEEELSDAARSLLLALWSLEGKSGLSLLNRAFLKLHAHRARKYAFERTPQDFKRALKELNGSFANPWGPNGLQIADPSLLDLIGGVLREAPDNIVDLLVGAALFSQVERLWLIAREKDGVTHRRAWKEAAGEAVSVVRLLMLEERRVDHRDGSTTWHGATYERRLTVVLEVAARVGANEYRRLVDPIAARLFEEPLDDGVDINALVDLVVSLESEDMAEFSAFVRPLRERVFEAARQGCRSDELREATRLLEEPPSDDDLNALRAGYAAYDKHYFSSERWECRSEEEFSGLIEDLTLFQESLGVDTGEFVAEVLEALEEFLESEERYADAHEDEYKEQWREARYENESIADMFGSLRSGRNG